MTVIPITKPAFSQKLALITSKLHFATYGGKYKLPTVPRTHNGSSHANEENEVLLYWLNLATQHRQPNSIHSLVPEVLNFYHTHLQKTFADVAQELETFCKAAGKITLFDELSLMIENSFFHLQDIFEADLLYVLHNTIVLSPESFHYNSYAAGRTELEQTINSFASDFFQHAKASYTTYVNQIEKLLNTISQNN